jgi:hypothetical protein
MLIALVAALVAVAKPPPVRPPTLSPADRKKLQGLGCRASDPTDLLQCALARMSIRCREILEIGERPRKRLAQLTSAAAEARKCIASSDGHSAKSSWAASYEYLHRAEAQLKAAAAVEAPLRKKLHAIDRLPRDWFEPQGAPAARLKAMAAFCAKQRATLGRLDKDPRLARRKGIARTVFDQRRKVANAKLAQCDEAVRKGYSSASSMANEAAASVRLLASIMLPSCPDANNMAYLPWDMYLYLGFCIDKLEAPDDRNPHDSNPVMRGRPNHARVAVTAQYAEQWCKNHGKRLCREDEWVRACTGPGPAFRTTPYGGPYRRGACNDDKSDIGRHCRYPGPKCDPDVYWSGWKDSDSQAEANRLYQGEPRGHRPGCATPEGINDLFGNVAEWAIKSYPGGYGGASGYVMKGGLWWGVQTSLGAHATCTNKVNAHAGSYRTYEVGFRCCADWIEE